MFFTLSKIIDFLLLPITWIIILTFILLFSKKASVRKRIGILLLTILILGSNTLVVNTLFSAYEMPQTELENTYEVGIILGGGIIRANQEDQDRINLGESADRVMQPLFLYKQGYINRILITGGNTSIGNLKVDKTNETEQVKRLLISLGVPSNHIITENRAKNTHENALYSKQTLDSLGIPKTILLVTSAYHMRRSVACFEKEGFQVTPYVVDSKKKDTHLGVLECIIPSERELFKFSYLIREIIGFGIYRIMGYV
jgi:uncharacterized SAM-binding protein YcdF (DUF218 family)